MEGLSFGRLTPRLGQRQRAVSVEGRRSGGRQERPKWARTVLIVEHARLLAGCSTHNRTALQQANCPAFLCASTLRTPLRRLDLQPCFA